MDFSVSDDQRAIRDGVSTAVRQFDDAYWLARDDDDASPHEFHCAMAEAIGIGQDALGRAARYARERIVFGRPIGQNPAIQHLLAEQMILSFIGERVLGLAVDHDRRSSRRLDAGRDGAAVDAVQDRLKAASTNLNHRDSLI